MIIVANLEDLGHMAKRKILLLEDDEIDQRMIIWQLPSFEVLKSETIEDACKKLEAYRFDLVLLDLNLPDSSGIDTYQSVRQAAKDTPIIVLSGEEQEQVASLAISLGAQDFVSKDRIPDQKRFADTIDFAIQRSRLAIELKKAEAITREQSEYKSQFLAQFSHEIRTPLNAVIGMAHLLEQHVQGEAKEYLGALQVGANRLFSIVDDILDITKIESGEIKIFPKMVNIREAVEGVVKLYGSQTEAKGVDLIAKINPNVPQKIEIDSKRFCQVLTNLLSNAVKFTKRGSIIVDVNYMNSRLLQVKVIDTGSGMSEQDCDKLFRPFVQVGELAGKQGTGLGLSICKKIVAVMGGDISVDSQIGRGTTFCFTLDGSVRGARAYRSRFSFKGKRVGLYRLEGALGQAVLDYLMMRGIEAKLCSAAHDKSAFDVIISDAAEDHDGADISRHMLRLVKNKNGHIAEKYDLHLPLLQSDFYAQLARFFGEKQKTLRSKKNTNEFFNLRVLVVDDDPMNRMVIEKLLSRHSVKTKTAKDGQEAVDAWCGDHEFDLILMDCSMPVMDGFHATKKLRELDCSVPIIALTAHAFDKHKDHCQDVGMNGFLTKPINVPELEKVLKNLQLEKYNENHSIQENGK